MLYYRITANHNARQADRMCCPLTAGGRIITVGSDAHTASRMGDHLEEAYRILRDEIGFTQICTFDKMEPVFHLL